MNIYDNIEVLRLQTPEELARHRQGELDTAWLSLCQALKAMGVFSEPIINEQAVVAEAEQIVQEPSIVFEAEQIAKQAAMSAEQALRNTYDAFAENPLFKGNN